MSENLEPTIDKAPIKKAVRRGRVRKKPLTEEVPTEKELITTSNELVFEAEAKEIPSNTLPSQASFELLSKPLQVTSREEIVSENKPISQNPSISTEKKQFLPKPKKEFPTSPKYRNFQKQNHHKSNHHDKRQDHSKHISRNLDKNHLDTGRLAFQNDLKTLESLDTLAKQFTEQEPLDFNSLYTLTLLQMQEKLKSSTLNVLNKASKRAILNGFLSEAAEKKQGIMVEGIVEILNNHGDGFLVYSKDNYKKNPLGVFIPQVLMRTFKIKRGQSLRLLAMAPGQDHSCLVGLKIIHIMGQEPEKNIERIRFNDLIAYYPLERILLETDNDVRWDNLSMRIFDLLTPIGFGQRGLIVAPPRTGKTVLLQAIANSISKNHPQAHLIVLLLDERPEEVTDFKRNTKAEVISSTFDEEAQNHVHIAEMTIEKARCLVEAGQHVIILLDSITRLARAYNATAPSSGKVLSGGVEANALQGPKRIFGSARNIEGGGSLTILGTALVETNSKMDEVIFEEFKGTGNMEVHLDRTLSDKRIFPAIHLEKSGTRKEELLYHKEEMIKIHALRRAMKGVPSNEAIDMLIQRVKKTPNNAAFLMGLSR